MVFPFAGGDRKSFGEVDQDALLRINNIGEEFSGASL